MQRWEPSLPRGSTPRRPTCHRADRSSCVRHWSGIPRSPASVASRSSRQGRPPERPRILPSAGGRAVATDGAAEATIPAGALGAPIDLTIRTLRGGAMPAPPPGLRTLGAVQLGPSGTRFSTSVSVTIPLLHSFPPGTSLAARSFDDLGALLPDEGLTATVGPTGDRATVAIRHFSGVAVLGAPSPLGASRVRRTSGVHHPDRTGLGSGGTADSGSTDGNWPHPRPSGPHPRSRWRRHDGHRGRDAVRDRKPGGTRPSSAPPDRSPCRRHAGLHRSAPATRGMRLRPGCLHRGGPSRADRGGGSDPRPGRRGLAGPQSLPGEPVFSTIRIDGILQVPGFDTPVQKLAVAATGPIAISGRISAEGGDGRAGQGARGGGGGYPREVMGGTEARAPPPATGGQASVKAPSAARAEFTGTPPTSATSSTCCWTGTPARPAWGRTCSTASR